MIDLSAFTVQETVFYIGIGLSAGLGFMAGLWS